MPAGWRFDNSYARLPSLFFSRLKPEPVPSPALVILNEALAAELGLDAQALCAAEGVQVFAGNALPPGAEPLAQAYAGHQFGYFTMLGDGRAILLGEHLAPDGRRFDIQLKGSGRTPYSRGGDGRAVLGPMLREYIISEAMHGLGIPTTRSLAVVTTGEEVLRETLLPGAVLTRVAASHLRVGTFQFAAVWGSTDQLRTLADYALRRHFPEIDPEDPGRFLQLLEAVIERQAALVARWQLVGFVHGVMNTDNMTISGETIDYGPCAFMDGYDPATVFSSIDTEGRYAYGNQPRVAGWNLTRFAEALLPLLDTDKEKALEKAREAVGKFPAAFTRYWLEGMRRKLGLSTEEEGDGALIDELLRLMQEHKADFTNTFRALTLGRPDLVPMTGAEGWQAWHARWQVRLDRQPSGREAARQLMKGSNPAIIPRNHRVEEALTAAVDRGDLGVLKRLLAVLEDPYAYSPDQEHYAALPPPSSQPYRTFCGT